MKYIPSYTTYHDIPFTATLGEGKDVGAIFRPKLGSAGPSSQAYFCYGPRAVTVLVVLTNEIDQNKELERILFFP